MHQNYAHLFPTPAGIALVGVVIIKRNKDRGFDIEGREKHIHAMIQAAHGRPFPPHIVDGIKRGCKWFSKLSDEELRNAAHPYSPNPHAKPHSASDVPIIAKGLMEFALIGCNDVPELADGKARLVKVQQMPYQSDTLMKAYGLPTWDELRKDASDDSDEDDDSEDDSFDSSDDSGDESDSGGGNGRYNPDEPRIPAGQSGGGQWTTGDGTTSDSGSISADDVRNDPTDTVTQIGTVTPMAYTTTQTVPADNDNAQDIKTISTGIQTDGYGFIKPVSTWPDGTGNDVNQVNIFIGGAFDQTAFRNVESSSSLLTSSYGSNYYFTHSDENEINDFINNLPDGTILNVIGHSWGGDTAARVALDNPGEIDNLITIDPVTTFHTRPDLNTVSDNVDNWVNVDAVGHGGPFDGFTNGNVVAGFGAWNDAPNGIADSFITANYPHAAFGAMMNVKNNKTNQSAQGVINNTVGKHVS